MLQATTNELQFQEAQSTPHKPQSGLHRMSVAITNHIQFQETQGKPHKPQPGLPRMSQATTNELQLHEAQSKSIGHIQGCTECQKLSLTT